MIQLIIIYFTIFIRFVQKNAEKFRQKAERHNSALKKEGFPAFCCRKSFSFYFLRILRLIHLKRFVARSFEEAVAALCGEVIPFSVDQFPSFYGVAVCVNVISLLGVVCIAVRVQGNPFAFWPIGLRLRYRTSSPHRFWSKWRLPDLPFFRRIWISGRDHH